MVLADDAMTNWSYSGSSIEDDDWCYNRFNGVLFQFNDDYLSTVPISKGNIQIEINGQSVAADQKFVTLQYMPPYIELNITTTNAYEGAIKGILHYSWFSSIRPYQELPIQVTYIQGTPKDQPMELDVFHVIADKESRTCNVSRLDRIYITVQHLELPEIGTFEACNICNNDTYHRMDKYEIGYIRQLGYQAECPEMQRIALDGRLSERNCRELADPNIPGEKGWGTCSCLYSYGKTREEEQRDRSRGIKAFTTAVESVVLLWLITAFLFY
eukprot:scaffold4826_cov274-Chaetoceros_neogracile.AAC.6